MKNIFFIISVPVIMALDGIWLTIIAKNWYRAQFKPFLEGNAFTIRIPAALLVYILLIIGFYVYVIPAIIERELSLTTFLHGALFGGIVYGVYDLTNYATLPQWPLALVIGDAAWGAILFGLTSVITKYIVTRF